MEIPHGPTTDRCPWQQLVARYETPLRRWIRRRLAKSGSAAPEEAVEDLLQDVYFRLLQRHGPSLADLRTEDSRRLSGYLATVARHTVIDFVRYHRAQKRGAGLLLSLTTASVAARAALVQAQDGSPEQALLAKQGLCTLWRSLAGIAGANGLLRHRLGGLLRTILEGWTSREAERLSDLGLSAGLINTQLHRLRVRAREGRPAVFEIGEGRGMNPRDR